MANDSCDDNSDSDNGNDGYTNNHKHHKHHRHNNSNKRRQQQQHQPQQQQQQQLSVSKGCLQIAAPTQLVGLARAVDIIETAALVRSAAIA